MRILFMGSGEIALPCLEGLLGLPGDEVVAVVTQPDRPKGRKLKVGANPVKVFATGRGLTVLDPEKVGAKAAVGEIEALAPDLVVVAAYGQYIRPAILAIPPLGSINLHPSLLPRYRGASPIQMAIAEGETETGVTILYVSEEMDAGDIILQRKVPIDPDDSAASLAPRLGRLGAAMILEAVELLRAGTAPRIPQDESAATRVQKLTKADGRLEWSLPAETLRNRVRGFNPWPGTWCTPAPGSEARLKVLRVQVEEAAGTPGEILDVGGDGPLIGTGRDALRLLEVQPEGKRPMSGKAFLSGHPRAVGETLG